jgi:hypothetical protein
MQAHMAQHYSFKYFVEMQRKLGNQLPQPGQFGPDQPMPPEIEQQIAQAAAMVPQIQIMDPEDSMDPDDEVHEREQARLDDAHDREMARQDERTLAEIERQEMAAMDKERREDFMAGRKEQREARANEAKITREDKLAAAKAATTKKARPSGTS